MATGRKPGGACALLLCMFALGCAGDPPSSGNGNSCTDASCATVSMPSGGLGGATGSNYMTPGMTGTMTSGSGGTPAPTGSGGTPRRAMPAWAAA